MERPWKMENFKTKLPKQNNALRFKKTVEHISPEIIQNGFRESGLCPFNVDNVSFQKIATNFLKSFEMIIGRFQKLFNNSKRICN